VRIKFVWIGATKSKPLGQLEEDYLQRIGRFLALERVVVPESKKTDPRQAASSLDREAKEVLNRTKSTSLLVALDPAGSQMSSRELSKFLEDRMLRGEKELGFLVGGHWGLPPRLTERIDKKISLSKMTFPHELARVMLLEQVYRALSIVKGLPYHR